MKRPGTDTASPFSGEALLFYFPSGQMDTLLKGKKNGIGEENDADQKAV